jgi:hypothetical protein
MQYRQTIAAEGASFIIGVLAFVRVFSYLAANSDFPDIVLGAALLPLASVPNTHTHVAAGSCSGHPSYSPSAAVGAREPSRLDRHHE